MRNDTFTAIIRKEGKRYSSLCPELDIASAGDSIPDAIDSLRVAIRLYFRVTKKSARVKSKSHPVLVTQVRLAS